MNFSFKDSLLSKDEITNTAKTLDPYLKHLRKVSQEGIYDYDESSINLAFDDGILNQALKLKEEIVSDKLKYFIDIGIGGSNLGTKAIYDSLFGYFDSLEPNRFPKMIFADTNDPEFLIKLKNLLKEVDSPEQVLINAISKSGTTTETAVNLEVILASLSKKFSQATDRLVATTDQDSKLWNQAIEKNIQVLSIPKKVGGRYSVFSAVGLFPLLVLGIRIEKLLAGARNIRQWCLADSLDNPALVSAIVLFRHSQHDKAINDNFFFHPELESVGKWYRQLMGESIGKEKDLTGKEIRAGITPTVSVGSTDLHSMAQLYLGGPKDKVTTFVYSDKSEAVAVPAGEFELVENIEGKKTSEIMTAILEGVKLAYAKKGLPFMEVILADISEYSLGEFLQFKMMEMMFLGKLLGVNTFDQPNVEEYKTETRKILLPKSIRR